MIINVVIVVRFFILVLTVVIDNEIMNPVQLVVFSSRDIDKNGSSCRYSFNCQQSAPEDQSQFDGAVLARRGLRRADCSRARILALLRDGPHCVCELAAALGERSNNVSNHLARLREAGLVATSQISRDSRRVYYERDEIACAAALAQLRILLEPA